MLAGVHDIYLPDDYPPDVIAAHYSEQYLLACWLLAEPGSLRPVLPLWHCAAELPAGLGALRADLGLDEGGWRGTSFWVGRGPA